MTANAEDTVIEAPRDLARQGIVRSVGGQVPEPAINLEKRVAQHRARGAVEAVTAVFDQQEAR